MLSVVELKQVAGRTQAINTSALADRACGPGSLLEPVAIRAALQPIVAASTAMFVRDLISTRLCSTLEVRG